MIVPVTKRAISERIASRYEPVDATTKAKICVPIHEVPRSLMSYTPK